MEFFAGVNTEKGFKGYMEHYFEDCRRVYIIKGTSGSGKSTLMKKIADYRESLGEETVRIKCSSDTESLDGVIFPQKKIALCDGTSPHIIEPKIPVAREILVDTGRFVNRHRLDAQKVTGASEQKALCYKKMYLYIGAAVTAEKIISACRPEDKEKLCLYAKDFYKSKLYSGQKGETDYRVISAFTPNGVEICGGFDTDKTFTVDGASFINALRDLAAADKERVTLCPHHTDSTRLYGIYFHGTGVLVTEGDGVGENQIDLSRFTSKNGDFENAESVRHIAYGGARREMEKAKKHHFELEKEYSAAMDFSALDGLYKYLLKETM